MRGLTFYSVVAVAVLASVMAGGQDVHVHVSPESTGTTASRDDFPTIQMAMDHAPEPGPGGRLYLHIAPGIYHERVFVTQNRPRTTFLGTGGKPEDVVITASQSAKSAGGTFFSSTVEIDAGYFEADNLTFENAAGHTGQAVAVAVRSDRSVFKHCRFLGDQDTLFADYGRQYYTDSYIEGGVDFIFGNASAVFDDDELHVVRPGYLTAQSRASPEQNTGYIFRHARITTADLGDKSFYLGRPWRPFSRVVFLSSEMPPGLSPEGWSSWRQGESIGNTFYAERGSFGPGAHVATRLKGAHLLTAAMAARFAPEIFLAGTDHWNPVVEASRLP
jgi:pectinesterase